MLKEKKRMTLQIITQKTQAMKLGCQILHHEYSQFLYNETYRKDKVKTKHPFERKYCNKREKNYYTSYKKFL